MMEPLGPGRVSRTGIVAIARGSSASSAAILVWEFITGSRDLRVFTIVTPTSNLVKANEGRRVGYGSGPGPCHEPARPGGRTSRSRCAPARRLAKKAEYAKLR